MFGLQELTQKNPPRGVPRADQPVKTKGGLNHPGPFRTHTAIRPHTFGKACDRSNSLYGNNVRHGDELIGLSGFHIKRNLSSCAAGLLVRIRRVAKTITEKVKCK